jgi:hypothetical protein
MAALFEELIGRRYGYSIGDGELHRTLRVQRRHFRPPLVAEDSRRGAQLRILKGHPG